DVEFFRIDAQLVATIDHLHGVSLVQLPEIDVINLQAMPLQKPRHRCDRANTHLVGLDAGDDETTEDAERLEPLLRSECIAHDHTGGRTLRKLARVSSGDGLALE